MLAFQSRWFEDIRLGGVPERIEHINECFDFNKLKICGAEATLFLGCAAHSLQWKWPKCSVLGVHHGKYDMM